LAHGCSRLVDLGTVTRGDDPLPWLGWAADLGADPGSYGANQTWEGKQADDQRADRSGERPGVWPSFAARRRRTPRTRGS
jgi:hypothetical protein